MELKAGTRLQSAVSEAQVVVIRAPSGDVVLTCGGEPMVDGEGGARLSVKAGAEGSVVLGKRYVDPEDTIEVLATKAGDGALALGGAELVLKTAKPLPSSD
ncbi:MAG: hypothetical protein JO368_01355 [Acidimicrobiales bacterium]|nr:hypothetical protein [Acidimicrobiales bacterium]